MPFLSLSFFVWKENITSGMPVLSLLGIFIIDMHMICMVKYILLCVSDAPYLTVLVYVYVIGKL